MMDAYNNMVLGSQPVYAAAAVWLAPVYNEPVQMRDEL